VTRPHPYRLPVVERRRSFIPDHVASAQPLILPLWVHAASILLWELSCVPSVPRDREGVLLGDVRDGRHHYWVRVMNGVPHFYCQFRSEGAAPAPPRQRKRVRSLQ